MKLDRLDWINELIWRNSLYHEDCENGKRDSLMFVDVATMGSSMLTMSYLFTQTHQEYYVVKKPYVVG
jgi:hypothetical protein